MASTARRRAGALIALVLLSLGLAWLTAPSGAEAQASNSVSLSGVSHSVSQSTITVTGTVSWSFMNSSYSISSSHPHNRNIVGIALTDGEGTVFRIQEINDEPAQTGSLSFSVSQWRTMINSYSPPRYTSGAGSDYWPSLEEQVNVKAVIGERVVVPGQSRHYYQNAESDEIALLAPRACQDSDAQPQGTLSGYNTDLSGELSRTDCVFDSYSSDVYSFTLRESRDVSFTFTPHDRGARFRFSIYRGGISSTALGSATGSPPIEIGDENITANTVHYVVVGRSGTGGGFSYSLQLQYGFIQPPTPTPAPTPTPRIQPNLDFRLHPDPSGFAYEVDSTYTFETEGPAHVYPVTVRSANASALELSLSSPVTCRDVSPDQVRPNQRSVVYVKACEGGKNSTLEVVSESGDFLAEYSVYVRGGPIPTPVPATVPQGLEADVSKRDQLGVGILVSGVCGGFGVGCDIDLITNLLVTAAAVGVMAFLLRRSRGAATSMSIGVATAFGLVVLMLGHLWVGFPLWIVVMVLIPILALGGIAGWMKMRQVG